MQKLRRMEGRVVLLTGGSGIARGVARAFAEEGASMILTGLFMESIEKGAAHFGKLNIRRPILTKPFIPAFMLHSFI